MWTHTCVWVRKESEKEGGFVIKVNAIPLISSYLDFEIKSADIYSIDIMESPLSFCVNKSHQMTEKNTYSWQ